MNNDQEKIDRLITLMSDLYSRGELTYGDLAKGVACTFEIPLLVAQRSMLQIASENGLIEEPMTDDELPPTIEQTVAGFSAMAARLKPKPKTVSNVMKARLYLGPRNTNLCVELFEHYRPRRSPKKWLVGAPDYVTGCYDNGGKGAMRYTVTFGGWLWSAEYAYTNWQSGLDPHLTPCLRMSADLTVVTWWDCIRTRWIGTKISWADLPPRIRQHVRDRVAQIGDEIDD